MSEEEKKTIDIEHLQFNISVVENDWDLFEAMNIFDMKNCMQLILIWKIFISISKQQMGVL